MRNNPWRGKKMQSLRVQRVCSLPMLTIWVSPFLQESRACLSPHGLWGVHMHRGCPVLNCCSSPISSHALAQAAQDISCKKAKDGGLVVWKRRQLGSVKPVLLSPCHSAEAAHLACLLCFSPVFSLLFKNLRAWGSFYQVRRSQEKQTHSSSVSFQMQIGGGEWSFCIYFALSGCVCVCVKKVVTCPLAFSM